MTCSLDVVLAVTGHRFDLVFKTELVTVSNLLNLNTVLCNLAEDLITRVNALRMEERPRYKQRVRLMRHRRLRTTETKSSRPQDTPPGSKRRRTGDVRGGAADDIAALFIDMSVVATPMFDTHESADSVRLLAAAECLPLQHVSRMSRGAWLRAHAARASSRAPRPSCVHRPRCW